MNYQDFFQATTRTEKNRHGFEPMGWQCRLACGNEAGPTYPRNLKGGVECQSRLIDIPTGCGKTAAVVLAWLWNRIIINRSGWPRRLVYCLPMRTLVDQTRDNVTLWLRNLLHAAAELEIGSDALAALHWLAEHSPVILMGGEESADKKDEWDLYPEMPAILIGTQDMLLSRALNRGYAMSRYRWPILFGLLNNDSLWVCDEVQLMGAGLATACQLEAFRRAADAVAPHGFESYFGARSFTWYASATTNEEALRTRDWRAVERSDGFAFSLAEVERSDAESTVGRRRFADKRLESCEEEHFGRDKPPDEVVSKIAKRHAEMVAALREHSAPAEVPRRSLIICNTVDRALAVFGALSQNQASGAIPEAELVLLHSRFRPRDREQRAKRLTPEQLQRHPGGQIVVSTQVVEAGVDISSGILWTEVAPLSSLVQRLGRLNRNGEFGSNGEAAYGWEPVVSVVGIEPEEASGTERSPRKKKQRTSDEVATKAFLPYDKAKCESAWVALRTLSGDASPAALESIRGAIADSIERCPYSLQRHELLDFFDTDSNLSLGYTDVSPFVRSLDDDTDVYVLWREWDGSDKGEQPPFFNDVQRDELCAVPISRLANWRQGWLWLGKERGWVSASAQGVFPGATLMLPCSAGAYKSDRGWTGNVDDKPDSCYQPEEQPSDEDLLSYLNNGWRSIAAHGLDVRDVLNTILECLPSTNFLTNTESKACRDGAIWHDLGKNHKSWQEAVAEALNAAELQPPSDHSPFAKFSLFDSPRLKDEHGNRLTGDTLRREVYKLKRKFSPRMAHEVASALALRQRHIQTDGQSRSPATGGTYLAQLLSEYLVMSHHGRVRKVLRDEIPKNPKAEKDANTVRGVSEGDPLRGVTIDGDVLGCEALSVDCRRMGRDPNGHESWTRSVLRLVEHYGPFRLAYLEAIFRAADRRASRDLAS